MKVLQINSVCGVGSTGRICTGIAEVAENEGLQCAIAYGRAKAPPDCKYAWYRIESDVGVKVHALKSRLFGKTGTYSMKATERFLKRIDEYKPDILHLHNIHGYYLNYPLLFDYIKKNNIKVVWTLHDCWAFTGHCAYFDIAGCEKWKTKCNHCALKSEYPKSLIDSSVKSYELKKDCFNGVANLMIATPSQWLADLVRQSYLKNYPVRVINNGIDLETFRPTDTRIKEKLSCDGKKIILGVAYCWDKRKGIDVFEKLAERLDDRYKIVLVGVDKKKADKFSKRILAIPRTENQKQLAELYTAADVFLNPTREENFPTVNIEALACGTPVITFDTGGSPETIDEHCGMVVPKNDFETLIEKVKYVCDEHPFSENDCLQRAKLFDRKDKFIEYTNLYEEMTTGDLK